MASLHNQQLSLKARTLQSLPNYFLILFILAVLKKKKKKKQY